MPRHALRPLACALALTLASTLAAPAVHAQAAKPPAACTDFYGHANADWLQNNPLTDCACRNSPSLRFG